MTGGQRVAINRDLDGNIIYVSGLGSRSTVIQQEINFLRGTIHVVDAVLAPPAKLDPTLRGQPTQHLQAFLGALYSTGLIDEFSTDRDVTIFAPTNAAFQLISKRLSNLSKHELREVLAYHIVPNKVLYSTDLVNGSSWATYARTVNPGLPAKLTVSMVGPGNNIFVDTAQIVDRDILVANGVVHMMNSVLSPAVKPVSEGASQSTAAAFELTGSSPTGPWVAVPFTDALPCMTDCPTRSVIHLNPTSRSRRLTTSESRAVAATNTALSGAIGVVGMGALGVAVAL